MNKLIENQAKYLLKIVNGVDEFEIEDALAFVDGFYHRAKLDRKAVLQEAREIAKARVDALESLLVCYRVGKQPTEKLHSQLSKSAREWNCAIQEAMGVFDD